MICQTEINAVKPCGDFHSNLQGHSMLFGVPRYTKYRQIYPNTSKCTVYYPV